MIIYSLGPPTVPVHHHVWLLALIVVGLAGTYVDLKRRQRRRDTKVAARSAPTSSGNLMARVYPHSVSPWSASLINTNTSLSLQGYDPRGLPEHNWIGSDGTPICHGRGCMCCR